jgi:hypothetical protein
MAPATSEQADRGACAADLDANDAQDAAIQPCPAAKAGDVPGAVRVVGYQQRVRRADLGAARAR